VGSAVAAVVASSVVVLATPQVAEALPSVCSSGSPTVRVWTGSSDHTTWGDGGNWSPAGIPGDRPGDVICIETTDTIDVGANTLSTVDQLHVAGSATIVLHAGAGIFANGSAESVWAAGTSVQATGGQLGGSGTIRVQGALTLGSTTSAGTLTSRDVANGPQPPADTGELVVEGQATVADLGAVIRTGYTLSVAGGGSLTVTAGSSVTADDGTALTIQPGGLVDLAGDGGYYPGFDVSGLTKSVVTNNGTLRKSGGSGTSVVQGKYLGTGTVAVLSGTLAMPDNQKVGAAASAGTTFATGRCDSVPACQPTTNPATDPMSLGFTVPGTNGAPALVQLEERGVTADVKQIGNEVLAHADGLVPDAAHPARLVVRYSQPEVMATPLGEVQVVHTDEGGRDSLVPDCSGGTLPTGLYYCVVRPVTRDAQNTYVTVLAATTSRWHLRRALPVENQGSPEAPHGLRTKRPAPFDGSVLGLTWTAPDSSGAGPVSGYKTYVDGKLRTTTTSTSLVLKNVGAGKHTIAVSALNAAGQGPRASITVTIDPLSKPRRVDERAGASGGDRTAGVVWRPPAEAGGLRISGYQVAVFAASGRKVAQKLVSPGKRQLFFALGAGEYRFRVRARNADGYGPWSRPTDLVRPR
jgi:hypothetical protein